MAPKKQPRNGYYYFMLDLKQRQGRSFKSMQEVASAAAPFWARLTAEQRQVYNDMAKVEKENQSKQTAIGENLEYVMKDELDKQIQEQQVKTDIENIINKAVKSCDIADHYFYIMHINIFCKCDSNGRFYPAEIAIGRFNLREGVKPTEVFHSLIHPGTLPIGYSNTARLHSEETHQIPPPGPDAENNLEEVFASIVSFVTDQNSDATLVPPIYVYTEKQVNIAENVLDYLTTYFGSNMMFKIYPLQYMFFILRNNLSKNSQNAWPTISMSIIQLEKDVYDFTKGISCDFHESTDTPVHCSRSRVIRFAYIICDNCIKELEIKPILEQHVPYNAALSPVPKRPSSRASVTSTSLQQSQSVYETPAGSFMPSRSTSRMSTVSETSTLVDESDTTSYRGFDTESQVEDDEDEWRIPKSRGRKGVALSTSSSQPQSSQSQLSEDFKSLSMSQTSSDSEYIPKRRPVKISGVLQTAFGSNLNNAPFVGRGRGRGILNKLSQN